MAESEILSAWIAEMKPMDPCRIAFEFIEDCRLESGVDALLPKVANCGRTFGFEHFILTGLPPPNGRIEQYVLANHWPKEWYERFCRGNYFHDDGVGQWALRTNQPFTYGEVPETFRQPCKARAIRAEAKAFGLADGLVVPIRSVGYRQSAFSFSCGSRCDLGPQDRAALHLIAIYAERTIRNTPDHAPAPSRLSAREREVLAWAAEGKSAWETSVIISVSARTVTKHLEHIRAKLNAATTAQAVAEGLRRGEIVL